MTKASIGLGVLSIPTVFDTLGIIPGVICLVAVGVIITWSGYVVGTFKVRHPEVYGVDDAGGLMFGRIGREVFGAAFALCMCISTPVSRLFLRGPSAYAKLLSDWTFIAGSGMLSVSIGLNAVSSHATCTAVFVVVGAIVGFLFASIRTLGKMSWLAWVGVGTIITSSMLYPRTIGPDFC